MNHESAKQAFVLAASISIVSVVWADTAVKIGQVSPLTGELAHIGKDDENGVRLAIEDLNSRKLVIGGQAIVFELDSQDDAADPKTAVTVAQKLVDDRVAGVVGHANSGTSIPASRIYAGAGIPMITESATNPLLTQQGFKSVFRMVANDVRQGSVIGSYVVKELKAHKVAIVDDRTAYGQGLADQIEKAVQAAGGTVIDREFGTDKTTNYDAVVTMAAAMQAAGSTDPKVYLPKLQAVKADGVTGPIQFDEAGDIRNGAITVRQFGNNVWNDRSVVR